MDDQQFRQLLNHLGLSWTGYRKVRKGVKKRIVRHMHKLACRSIEAYLLTLDSNQNAKKDCMRLMTVSISRFFRDKALWKTLKTDLLPSMIENTPGPFNVWSAGCARGEEVYTFKMVWLALTKHMGPLPELALWATDMHPGYLEKARMGIYSRSSLKEVSETMRKRYFQVWRKDKSWQIMDLVKEGIRWQTQDLFSPPPQQAFHLVFLRNNLLTYYENPLKVPALKQVISSIIRGGYLVIGSHEAIPPGFSMLQPSALHPCVFRKQNAGS
jgi:chemotaxis protein methyltransferase CheR